jgi:hypothetical protein
LQHRHSSSFAEDLDLFGLVTSFVTGFLSDVSGWGLGAALPLTAAL